MLWDALSEEEAAPVLPPAKRRSSSRRHRKKVWFMRHAESTANATGRDVYDAPLTDAGLQQAAAWANSSQLRRIQLLLISP